MIGELSVDGPRKAIVWNFFKKLDKTYARCNYCGDLYKYQSTTSNLVKHARKKHPDTFQQFEEKRRALEEGQIDYPIPYYDETSMTSWPEVEVLMETDESQNVDERADKEPTSDIWSFFTRTNDSSATCNLCQTELSCENSVINLNVHREAEHPGVLLKCDPSENEPATNGLHDIPAEENSSSTPQNSKDSGSNDDPAAKTPAEDGKTASAAWQYFTVIDGAYAECNTCGMPISRMTSANLMKHIRIWHSSYLQESLRDGEKRDAEENENEDEDDDSADDLALQPQDQSTVADVEEESVEETSDVNKIKKNTSDAGEGSEEETSEEVNEIGKNTCNAQGSDKSPELCCSKGKKVENPSVNTESEHVSMNENLQTSQDQKSVSENKTASGENLKFLPRYYLWKVFTTLTNGCFQCKICGTLMSRKSSGSNLHRHIKRIHGSIKSAILKVNTESEDVSMNENLQSSQDQKNVSENKTASGENWRHRPRSHVWKVFTTLKNGCFQCKICGKILSRMGSVGSLHRHIRIIHGSFKSAIQKAAQKIEDDDSADDLASQPQDQSTVSDVAVQIFKKKGSEEETSEKVNELGKNTCDAQEGSKEETSEIVNEPGKNTCNAQEGSEEETSEKVNELGKNTCDAREGSKEETSEKVNELGKNTCDARDPDKSPELRRSKRKKMVNPMVNTESEDVSMNENCQSSQDQNTISKGKTASGEYWKFGRRSCVWKVFTTLKNGSFQCKVCGTILSRKASVGNLHRHIRTIHGSFNSAIEKVNTESEDVSMNENLQSSQDQNSVSKAETASGENWKFRPRSHVWKVFTMLKNDCFQCKLCRKIMFQKTSGGNFNKHIRMFHPSFKSGIQEVNTESEDVSMNENLQSSQDQNSISKEEIASCENWKFRPRSCVWKVFTSLKNGGFQCKICGKILSRRASVGNLHRHIRTIHGSFESATQKASQKIEDDEDSADDLASQPQDNSTVADVEEHSEVKKIRKSTSDAGEGSEEETPEEVNEIGKNTCNDQGSDKSPELRHSKRKKMQNPSVNTESEDVSMNENLQSSEHQNSVSKEKPATGENWRHGPRSDVWRVFTTLKNGFYQCRICRKIMFQKRSGGNLNRHIRTIHGSIKSAIQEVAEKNEDDDDDDSADDLALQPQDQSAVSDVEGENWKFRARSYVWKVFTSLNNVGFQCKICGKILSRRTTVGNLHRHVRTIHGSFESATQKVNTESEDVSMIENLQSSQDQNSISKEETASCENRRHGPRSYVWRVFTTLKNGFYQCRICKKILFQKTSGGNLNRHIRTIHGSIMSAIQEAAEKNEDDDDDDSADDLALQPQDKPTVADVEGENWRRRPHSLAWKVFTKLKDGGFQCNICGVILSKNSTVSNLGRHVRRLHPSFQLAMQKKRSASEVVKWLREKEKRRRATPDVHTFERATLWTAGGASDRSAHRTDRKGCIFSERSVLVVEERNRLLRGLHGAMERQGQVLDRIAACLEGMSRAQKNGT